MNETNYRRKLSFFSPKVWLGALILAGLLAGCTRANVFPLPWGEFAWTAWLLLASVLFYLLPGGAAVAWLLQDGDWLEKLILATGTSTALYGLLVYATAAGLRLNSAWAIGFLSLCAGLLVGRWMLDRQFARVRSWTLGPAWNALRQDPSLLALLIVLVLVAGVRLWVTRHMAAPLWGDSYQHTMISQLLFENGGLFDSWEPYAPLTTFTYHFGFHANVVMFRWLSGDSMLHTVIWIGQLLNILAVWTLYPLAVKIGGGNRWAGVGTVLVAGLLSSMPMYYVNWGRYTQLTGQAILPVLLWLMYKLAEKARVDWKLVLLTGMTLAGLGVSHYRIILVWGVFVVAWAVCIILSQRGRMEKIGSAALHLFLAGLLAALLLVPWMAHLSQTRIAQIGQRLITTTTPSEFIRQEYNAIGSILSYMPWWVLAGGMVGLVWQTIRRQLSGWVMVLWTAGLFILSNPHILHLPGTGIVNNFTILIMLYIPVGILAGSFVGSLALTLIGWRPQLGSFVIILAIVLVSGWGAVQRIHDLNLGYAILTQADIEAMNWITAHTPQDAKFLVNAFMAYGGTSAVGADGGWWIPLLTRRASTLPPLSYGVEMWPEPDGQLQPGQVVIQLQQTPPTSPQGVDWLKREQVTHVYIGQKNGMVGNPGPPLLNADELSSSPYYTLVYHQDGVSIWELNDN